MAIPDSMKPILPDCLALFRHPCACGCSYTFKHEGANSNWVQQIAVQVKAHKAECLVEYNDGTRNKGGNYMHLLPKIMQELRRAEGAVEKLPQRKMINRQPSDSDNEGPLMSAKEAWGIAWVDIKPGQERFGIYMPRWSKAGNQWVTWQLNPTGPHQIHWKAAICQCVSTGESEASSGWPS
ncbi:hypothetical protein B0H10DRAFT_1941013 [Mycena sp. CBHHK59/15]|nr:hypothetical protein B0H10DRAFT_1941013 [Mycena sp. CBHHK59/15]